MLQAEIKPRTIGQQETNMNLDNTSHPGRPGPDELVPSRYALRVGEIDVMVVSGRRRPIGFRAMAGCTSIKSPSIDTAIPRRFSNFS
ncbi:hypothetical protein ABIA27_001275 [Sinorhizobium fredii]